MTTNLSRDAAARAFAELLMEPCVWGARVVGLPEPDAPLHEHLAFVGRIAEALCADDWLLRVDQVRARMWWVRLYSRIGTAGGRHEAKASDPSWAAMLSATAALRARRGK